MEANVKTVAETLTGAGFQALIAGGAVRDLLRGVEPHDVDFVTDATPDQVESLFPKTIPLGKSFGVMVVVMEDGEQFEVATFRKDSDFSDGRRPFDVELVSDASVDASRRDFTINAMFLNPLTGEVLDFFGGKHDLELSTIRFVGKPQTRIEEDHLRMLRAVRFAANLGFMMSNETFFAIRKNAHLIRHISAERIREELSKMLLGNNPKFAINLLQNIGLLAFVLPEVSALVGVEQPAKWHPEGDVFQHTLGVIDALKNSGNLSLLVAGLLHDIGKPGKAKFNPEKGHLQFIGHDLLSKDMAISVMKRLCFSNKEIEEVSFAIEHHMTMHNFPKMKQAKARLLMESPHFGLLLSLSMADTESTGKSAQDLADRAMELYKLPPIPKLINGDTLIAHGITNGPRIGRCLRAIKLGQLEGNITTPEQALKVAKGVA